MNPRQSFANDILEESGIRVARIEVGFMARESKAVSKPFRRRLGLVPRAAIRRLAQEIAERFQPERIILFGSYAYGKPNADSDVDLLVVMPAWNEISKAARIYQSIDRPFTVDLLVRTPQRLARRLAWGCVIHYPVKA